MQHVSAHVSDAALSLQQWGDVAQLVLAGTALIAVAGALYQIRVARGIHKRQLAYEYLRRMESREVSQLTQAFRKFWAREHKTWADYDALESNEQAELLVYPNLVEELASLYNRKRIDRDVIALTLGPLIEHTWAASQAFIRGAQAGKSKWAFCEWQEMQLDTVTRRRRAHAKIQRRRSRKNLFFGTGE